MTLMGLRRCETCDERVAVNRDLLEHAENGFYSNTSDFVGPLSQAYSITVKSIG